MIEGFRIRLWNEIDDLSDITDLLHRAYKPLADAGQKFLATYQDDKTTLDRLTSGVAFIGELGGKIIATATLYLHKSNSSSNWYNLPYVASFGQLAVEPAHQGNGFATQMIAHIEAEAKMLGANELALDTSESALHLIRYYEKLGYRFIEYTKWDAANYRSVIMSKLLEDKTR